MFLTEVCGEPKRPQTGDYFRVTSKRVGGPSSAYHRTIANRETMSHANTLIVHRRPLWVSELTPDTKVGTQCSGYPVLGVGSNDEDVAKTVVRKRPEKNRKRATRVLTRNLLFSSCSSTTTRQCAGRPLLTSFRRRRRRRRTLHVGRTSTDIGPRTGPRRWW